MTSRKKPQKKMSRVPFYVGGGILLLALVAFITAGLGDTNNGGNGDPTAQEFADVSVTGTDLPLTPLQGATDLALGMTMPEIQGKDFSGNPVSITNDGRPKAIVLLAHW
jgi:hypothetical protein